jgi:hypothetical protein
MTDEEAKLRETIKARLRAEFKAAIEQRVEEEMGRVKSGDYAAIWDHLENLFEAGLEKQVDAELKRKQSPWRWPR